jgi:lysophospholipase L1-like esterase
LPFTPEWWQAEIAFLRATVIDQPYPSTLQTLLAERYAAQSPVVINAGRAGETADDGEDRLPSVLGQHTPQVLLLQEGVNDVHQIGDDAPARVREDLRSMIQEARSRGVRAVFLGTLLPERREACKAFDFFDGSYDILAVNDQIRSLAAAEGATLVDLFQVFVGQENTLLGEDGLHPTPIGYDLMANTFFGAIRARLEQD